MSQFLLLAALLFGLATLVRRYLPTAALVDSLNWWVITVALPATVLELVPALHFNAGMQFLVAAQWLLAAAGVLSLRWLGTRLGWTRGRIAAITLMAAFSNTAFLGYPLLEALRGPDGVALGAIADQLGGVVAAAIGGAMVVAIYSGEQPSARFIVRKMLQFPPLPALIAGFLVGAAGGWPAAVPPILHRLAQTLAPLALFSVGLRLNVRAPRGQRTATAIALGWKLLLMPLVALGAGRALGVHGATLSIGVLQTAMAPMFTGAIIARQHDFDPDLADTVLSLGILLSFLTVPAWNLLLP